MPRKEFEAFTRLDASDVNTYLMDQSIMSFAGTAARGSAIATPVEGMATYLEDSNLVSIYDGTNWKNSLGATGGIIQVVSIPKTNVFSVSAGTAWSDITGLSATITPTSTSSRILVSVNATGSSQEIADSAGQLRQLRGSTVIHVGDAASPDASVSGSYSGRIQNANVSFTAAWTVLDSPNTTSAVVYSVQGRSPTAGTFFVNRSHGTGAITTTRAVSSITLMEVAS
jgi:hypothetical protein